MFKGNNNIEMNFRRTIRNYRTWLLMCSMLVTSSLFLLCNMVNQLSSDADNAFNEEPGDFNKLQDTHLRSIRNYEQNPKEQVQLLQILLPSNRNNKLVLKAAVNDLLNQHNDGNIWETKRGKLNQIIKKRTEVAETNDDDGDDSNEDEDEPDEDNESKTIDDNDNKEFQPGDFGNVVEFHKPPFRYEEIKPKTSGIKTGDSKLKKHIRVVEIKRKKRHHRLSETYQSKEFVEKRPDYMPGPYSAGIYWTSTAMETVPKGKSSAEISNILSYIRRQPVRHLSPPEWNKCGRPMNGIVTLRDGSMMCARYRTPHNRFILGESVSFHLSRLLGMDNIPPVVLSLVNDTQPQWYGINFTSLQWQPNQIVALIDWVPHLNTQGSQVVLPRLIHEAYVLNSSLTSSVLARQRLQLDDVSQLIQWGDLIIFDYLTGNYDRFASMQDAAEKDNKSSILREHVRNLRQSAKSRKLWLIDNESGLFDAYDLMYLERQPRFLEFHRRMLQTMCVFNKDLVTNLQKLGNNLMPDVIVFEFARSQERLVDLIPKDKKDRSFELFREKFAVRLKEVLQWIGKCKNYNTTYVPA